MIRSRDAVLEDSCRLFASPRPPAPSTAVVLLIAVELAHGSDYAREKKWADEITPNLVVGDALYLEGRAGHKVLALYTEAARARAALVIVHGLGYVKDFLDKSL